MSTFDGGSTGTLKSITLPAAMVECAARIQNAERSISTPPENVQLSSDFDANLTSITASLPITVSLDSSGRSLIAATDYLTAAGGSVTFSNGDGTLNSTHFAAALLEIAQLLSVAEQDLTTPIDNVQISFDLENLLASITASIPHNLIVNSGGLITVQPTDYV